MSREIKFRAWDKNQEIMFVYSPTADPFYIKFNGKIVDIDHEGEEGQSWSHLILMQYTGLKDKNGKCVYEGDVLNIVVPKFNNSTVYLVSFWYGRWVLVHPPTCGVEVEGECMTDALFHFKPEDLKVIGNLYENPELGDNHA